MAFECVECGYSSAKWFGRCPRCDKWDSIVEVGGYEERAPGSVATIKGKVENLAEVETRTSERHRSGMESMDRILGGGVVEGEVILLGGPPGVGKSTLFLQLADRFSSSGKKVLFASGEETASQIRVHADRLRLGNKNIMLISSGAVSQVESAVRENRPDVIFIDSIQAMIDSENSGMPGSVKQVRHCGQKLTVLAKSEGCVVFISGQITKQGDIAGPKVLEHMVDAVLYMDAMDGNLRLLSAAKNRFGSCGEFSMYLLTEQGLVQTQNAAELRAAEKVVGQASGCVRMGSRLVSVQLQSLISGSYFEYPLRRTSGYSRERLLMLSAIAEKYLGLKLGSKDIYLNVSGGIRVEERAADLGVICSLYSSVKDSGIGSDAMFLGEVGLNGEVRPLEDIGQRVNFAKSNNYKSVILSGYGSGITLAGMNVKRIKSVGEVKDILG